MNITDQFVKDYNKLIVTLVRKYVPPDDVQDIVQDVYVKLLQSTTYDPNKGGLGAYLGIVVRNVVIDQRQPDLEQYKDLEEQPSFMDDVRFDLDQRLSYVDPFKAEVFRRKYVYGYTHKEIARQLDISETQSQTIAHRVVRDIQ